MSIELITLLMCGALVLLLVLNVPLAFVTGIIAVGMGYSMFGPQVFTLIASRTVTLMGEFVLVSVPMFIFMAAILEGSGVAEDLFRAMHVMAGNLRGGLAVQTLLVAVIMAAMTGIIGGEIVLLGMVALPQMLKRGYDKRLAMGVICAGGSLGTMIPPSIVLIVYGLIANVPIGDLFIASVVPGLVLAGLYLMYVLIRCNLDPSLGPAAPPEERQMPLSEKLALLKRMFLPMAVIVWILGSIYGGIASVSEAAATGAAGALLAAWVRGNLTFALVRNSLHQTMSTCGMLLWLTFGANALIGVYNLVGGIKFVKGLMTGLPLEPMGVILVMLAILLLLGMVMDWIGIVLLTMPIFVPVVNHLGYDPVWFGVLFCMSMQIGYLTPPFGPAVFYLKGVAPPDITLGEIFKSVWPFVGLQMVGLTIVLMFPQLTHWLRDVAAN